LNPSNVVEQMELAKHEPYRKDMNLENHKIRIGNVEHNKGLSMHSHTELEYDLKGEYVEFRAVVGIDDELVAGSDVVVVKIMNGDKEMESITLDPKDKERRKNIALNIKDVQKLRLIVTRPAGEFHDLQRFASFGDARVSKYPSRRIRRAWGVSPMMPASYHGPHGPRSPGTGIIPHLARKDHRCTPRRAAGPGGGPWGW